MKYNYTSTLRINMNNISDLWSKLDKYPESFDEVLIFNQFIHSPKSLDYHREEAERIAPELQKLKERGIRAGINIHNTVGFFAEGLDKDLPPYKKSVSIDGYVNEGRICTEDPEGMEYVREQYRIYAAINPDMIYVDDDTSSLSCACDKCIERFAGLHPEFFKTLPATLENLQKLVESDDIPHRHKVRKAWIKYNALRMGELFENIEKAVHEVNPDIMLGIMSFMSGVDGIDTDNWAKKLLGENSTEIQWRPGRGVYTDYSMHELIEKAHRISAQIRYLPDFATRVESEIENFPYQSLRKSTSFTAFEAFIYQASGCTGTTYNVLCKEEEIGEEHEVFVKMAEDSKHYGKLLAEAFQRKALCGVGFWWDKESASYPTDDKWKFYKSVPTESEIFNIGIPYSCNSDNMSVYFMDKAVATHIPDKELLKCLSKGVLMDAEALKVINERGYGEYTGFKTLELYMKDTLEQELDHPLNMPNRHKRNIRQAFAWATKEAYTIEKTNDKAEYMSEHQDLYENVRGMASGVFENSLGGRICVEGITPFDFCYSLPRSIHVKNVIRWLSKDTLPAYIGSFHRGNIWHREDCVFIANTAMEDFENLELKFKTDADKVKVTVSKGAKIVSTYEIAATGAKNGYKTFVIPEIPMLGTALIERM
ncbi:MAG: hypothetical protein E7406_06025 [Ruminococcaceae bacterium]|nr:hypothetical protein [Oscillospiraceae bacterium]